MKARLYNKIPYDEVKARSDGYLRAFFGAAQGGDRPEDARLARCWDAGHKAGEKHRRQLRPDGTKKPAAT